MTWWQWLLIGGAAGWYAYWWWYTVCLLAWSRDDASKGTPLPADIHGGIIVFSMLISFIGCIPVMIWKTFEWVGRRLESGRGLKIIFPPISQEHKQLVARRKT